MCNQKVDLEAGAALGPYVAVKISSGAVVACAAGDAAIGVTADGARSGDAVPVVVAGSGFGVAGGAITKGDKLVCGAAGVLVKAAAAGTPVAIALQDAATGEHFELYFTPNLPALA